jgi:outer membrane cobalamin receptor
VLLRIDNAANKTFESARDYASAPRTAFIGIRYTPNL